MTDTERHECPHNRMSDDCIDCLLSDPQALHDLEVRAASYGGSLEGLLRELQKLLDGERAKKVENALEALQTTGQISFISQKDCLIDK